MARDFYGSEEILSSNNNPPTHHHHHHDEMVHDDHQIQGFVDTNPSHHHHHHQMFNMNTSMGLIDFSKQQQQQQQQQNHNHNHHHNEMMISMASGVEETSGGNNMVVEDSSITSMRCMSTNNNFTTCEDERPTQSQGLSLSLSSPNPTSINLHHHHHVLTTRVVGSSSSRPQQQHQGYFGKQLPHPQNHHHHHLPHSHIMMMMMMNNNNNNTNTNIINNTNHLHHHNQNHDDDEIEVLRSKYLVPTQEILNEFCSLGTKPSDDDHDEDNQMMMKQKKNHHQDKGKQQQWDHHHHHHQSNDNNNNQDHNHHNDESGSTSKHVPPLHSLEFMELHKRKTKLLSMLDEIDRRYHHYRDQMRSATSAFEAAAGVGAAATYTALAAKAMSRHFRCLRDGVVSQIQATKKAMGEREDPVAPGMSRGETPRLRLLDQAFRQQKVYRQMGLVDAHPWRPQRGLPERAVSVLRAWLFEHFLHPYPSDVDKHILARQTGLSRSQVSNWFINARVRLWKPMIEEMYSEETRGEPNDNNEEDDMVNPVLPDPKPEPNPVIRVEPEYLSSIITSSTKTDPKTSHSQTHHHILHGTTSYGSTFDFPLYGHQAVTYPGDSTSQGFEEGTRGVSLTLGLQRHDGNGGVSLAFSPAAQGGPLFYGRDHMEDCQQGSVQYSTSLLDGDHHQAQNLPYKNLMGAQLLHDIV